MIIWLSVEFRRLVLLLLPFGIHSYHFVVSTQNDQLYLKLPTVTNVISMEQ